MLDFHASTSWHAWHISQPSGCSFAARLLLLRVPHSHVLFPFIFTTSWGDFSDSPRLGNESEKSLKSMNIKKKILYNKCISSKVKTFSSFNYFPFFPFLPSFLPTFFPSFLLPTPDSCHGLLCSYG